MGIDPRLQESARELCLRLAAARRKRMVGGRPIFNLTDAEVRASTEMAMRLARGGAQNDASPRSDRGLADSAATRRRSVKDKENTT